MKKLTNKRLQIEMDRGIDIDNVVVNIINPFKWKVNIFVNDQRYIFTIHIPKKYPFVSPRVTVYPITPIDHPDIWGNTVTLHILFDGWSPVVTLERIILDLLNIVKNI